MITLLSIFNKGPVRVLCLILSLIVAFAILWDPKIYAANSSQFSVWEGLLTIWSVCVGVISGVGFTPKALIWQIVFFTPLAFIVLIIALFYSYLQFLA